MKARIRLLALVYLSALALPALAAAAVKKPVVGFVVKTLNNPFFIEMQHGAEVAAKDAGFELIMQAAEREIDVERQMQIVENLIQRKVDVLIIVPSGSREIIPVIVKANKAGIPVLTVDTRVDADALAAGKGKIVTFIGSDNFEGGKLAGKFVVEKTRGKASVGLLEGIAGHESGDARLRGFKEGIKAAAGVKITASQTANWERDQGYSVFQNMLLANPGIDTLFAANDQMALGAVEAIAAANKTGKIAVIGFDATDDARAAIKQGAMTASVAQSPAAMGSMAIKAAAKALAHETVPAEIAVPVELVK